jgi:hypothetical protein
VVIVTPTKSESEYGTCMPLVYASCPDMHESEGSAPFGKEADSIAAEQL